MRTATSAFAAVLSVLAAACGTTQPSQLDKRYVSPDVPAVTPADRIMTMRPFAPTDTGMLPYRLYPATVDGSKNPPYQPAPPVDLTEAEARQKLDAFMKAGAAGDERMHAAAMGVFDNPVLVAKIRNPSLRAAVAALTGTIAESAIQFYLSPSFREIRIDEADFAIKPTDTYIAYVWIESNGQSTYYINKKYRGESPFLFTKTLAHEPLHHDRILSNLEERIASSLDTLVLLQLLSRHPELARTTELARRQVGTAFIRLNSGRGPRLGLFDSNGDQSITPGGSGPALTSYWARMTNQEVNVVNSRDSTSYDATPGNAVLNEYLKAIDAEGLEQNPDFSVETLNAISQAPGPLTSAQLLAAARNMRLAVPADPVSP